MALKSFQLLSFPFLVFLTLSAIGHAKADIPSGKNSSSAFGFIKQLQGCHKGNKSEGIHQLKNYLREFGYLDQNQANNNDFDNALESAVKTYQQNFHIKPTGILDAATVSSMIRPRCGVPDIINGTNYMQSNRKSHASSSNYFHIVSHYSFFPGNPRWPPPKRHLTYKFLPGFPAAYVDPVRRAFQKWASATQYFTFSQVQTNQYSDLTVGFYRGAHGDNAPFDGRGGTLAHAYAPTDGRFHYDADESWSVGPVQNSFDVETVAVHEIGHLLGLGHSQVQGAIMFPSIASGTTKNIHPDDIQGIRALYNY